MIEAVPIEVDVTEVAFVSRQRPCRLGICEGG